MISACNEVVNFTNIRTGEVEFRIYDKDALHGQVTYVASSGVYLAIGYSSGTVLVYNIEKPLEEEEDSLAKATESRFEMLFQFSFHKSSITSLVFASENT